MRTDQVAGKTAFKKWLKQSFNAELLNTLNRVHKDHQITTTYIILVLMDRVFVSPQNALDILVLHDHFTKLTIYT